MLKGKGKSKSKGVALFNRNKGSSGPLKDFYEVWFNTLKNNLLPLLHRSISGPTPTLLSTHVEMLHHHFQSYYHALDLAATNDVAQLLFPSWRNPLEKPLIWVGDLHPYLLTNLVRCFLEDNSYDDDSSVMEGSSELCLSQFRERCELSDKPWQIAMAWKNPSETLMVRIDQIEHGLRLIVPTLTTRLDKAESAFVDRVAKDWFRCRGRKGAQKVAVGAALMGHTEELVSIFLDANRLRRSVLTEIIGATSIYQAALFLEALAQFLIVFRDQELINSVERCKMNLNKEADRRN
ncbi:hypothetical protein L6164_025776 [Bauhinia variegata]|uniref:Uncharacterized protein n=1 Tax=Bauhinia variegata TaxID=167791 RepID=A0ACB9M4I8_BAUVA|nr:hypothetical protein L6164_025776 [Bauhinia variegata]